MSWGGRLTIAFSPMGWTVLFYSEYFIKTLLLLIHPWEMGWVFESSGRPLTANNGLWWRFCSAPHLPNQRCRLIERCRLSPKIQQKIMGFFFLAQTLFHLFQCTKHSQNSNCPRQSSPEQFQAFLECVNPEQFVLCKLRAGADTLKSQYSILLCYQITTSQRGMVTRDKWHREAITQAPLSSGSWTPTNLAVVWNVRSSKF